MRIALIFLYIFSSIMSFSQVSTLDNYYGTWSDPGSWTSGIQPSPLTTSIDDGITINGYITRTGNLSFANVNQANDLVVNDTLVVIGNVTFANKSTNLIIPSGGLMIVFGDFSADNKIEVNNGGLLIVMGNMSFSSSPQDEYVDNGGGLYVDGAISGNGDADGIDQPIADLVTDGFDDIYDFVTSGGSTPLPVELLFFTATPSEKEVLLQWSTASELNNDFFTLERSRNGKDFEIITHVDGNGTSHVEIDYSFTDRDPYLGLSYYRLSQTDYDGTIEVFPVISAMYTSQKNLEVYPNPIQDYISVRASGKAPLEEIHLNIYNIQGNLILKKNYVTDAFGNLNESIPLDHAFENGLYLIELKTSNTSDIIKVQKQ